jgi:two-component system KDP operon response regulator KdpE
MNGAGAKGNILVVDDEPQITRVLKTTLASQGYQVRTASDGDEAVHIFKEWPPDLVITDLRMPNFSGLELCRHVRAKSGVPIIVLSVKGEEKTKVEALDAGADDYVTKPFGIHELLARVRAALRRAAAPELQENSLIELGDFRIDISAHNVQVKGRDVHLTPKEFDLLVHMAKHAGKVLTHRALLSAVWGGNSVEQPEYLRVFVGHLRKKLEPEESCPRYILTEPWVGYRFEPGD